MAYEPVRRGVGDHYLHNPRRQGRALGLGEDPAPMTDSEWRLRMLAAQEKTVAEASRFREQDRNARILQLIATVSIPLSAAIWRLVLRRSQID